MPTSRSKDRIIGITFGDPAGIGPEIIARSLAKPAIHRLGSFLIIGDKSVFDRYAKKLPPRCAFLDLKNVSLKEFKPGQPTRHTAQAAFDYLKKGVDLLRINEISSIVTAPVSKEAISSLGEHFSGHTEFLAEQFSIKRFEMMFVGKKVKAVLATRHIPLLEVPRAITVETLFQTIQLTHESLKELFKIQTPIIAICGLNPHAGEKGQIGQEEITTIIPAIEKAQKWGIHIVGPLAADTLFYEPNFKKYTAIIAMFHDQGLGPLKALYMDDLVNLTIGLPFVRTSPAHGTAYAIAGKNTADCSSMSAAIKLAAHLIR